MATPVLDHPDLPRLKAAFPDVKFLASEYRGQTTVVVPADALHRVMRLLHDDPACNYDFLSDVTAADYLGYPSRTPGRFAVVYLLLSTNHGRRLTIKTYLDPSVDTLGNELDPALIVPSVTDIWPGAEWREREVFDMYGIQFRDHPDHRRILTWETYPAFPLRKDYPLRGRGERERYRVMPRDAR
ncbi:MAG: NADH-quinone oxidoreductase subunit C [Phycisphaerales bacterium]|nr:NADH-quinone oxidoreductase subunit C [Phycisphaerae bacterium]NNF42151.1 NADH-quinone oxidoreductase subunit C [Phycisphaerales bacterium]NNM27118.1 NADH-quinone oxidoreductase subunit C [Phycisphaerales bacterium]